MWGFLENGYGPLAGSVLVLVVLFLVWVLTADWCYPMKRQHKPHEEGCGRELKKMCCRNALHTHYSKLARVDSKFKKVANLKFCELLSDRYSGDASQCLLFMDALLGVLPKEEFDDEEDDVMSDDE